MLEEISIIDRTINQLKDKLENSVYAVAKEVKELKTSSSELYYNAILDIDSQHIAEIHFRDLAPKSYPSTANVVKYVDMIRDARRFKRYKNACYNVWKNEIEQVWQIVLKYGGAIHVDDRTLKNFLNRTEKSKKFREDARISISVPGQNELRLVRNLERAILHYKIRLSDSPLNSLTS